MIAGLRAVLFGVLSGICFVGAHGWVPIGLTEKLFKAAAEHAFLASRRSVFL
jgi:hypothetical protein